ncbi:MAG: hypothetical protein JXP73_11435 [Deltaproteobacteria bacterium]|nr:hypothetical protein [Deltaproteobacteria bacterium]
MTKAWSQRRIRSIEVFQFLGVVGLAAAVGCGGSEKKAVPDARPDVVGGLDVTGPDLRPPTPEAGPEAVIRRDAPPVDVEPPVTDVAIEGPAVVLDAGIDVEPAPVDVAPVSEAGAGSGGITGSGGTTIIVGTGGRVGTGGTTSVVGTGGAVGTGGTTIIVGTGGAIGTGGATAEGGAVGTGGATATGGTTPTGGTGGTGGAGGTTVPPQFVPHITGWPTAMVIGPVACTGSAQGAASSTFTLHNDGSSLGLITDISFAGAEGYDANLTAGVTTIGVGQDRVVTVFAPPTPFPTMPGTLTSVLTVTTNEPVNNVHTINLSEAVTGPVLEWGSGATNGSMGGASPPNTLTQEFKVKNTGDADAIFDLTLDQDAAAFALSGGALTSITLTAGEETTRTLTFTAPAAPDYGTYSATIGLAPQTALCSNTPAPWTVTALSEDGYPQITLPPAPATFNKVLRFSADCGNSDQTTILTMTVTNAGTGPLPWDASIVPGGTVYFNVQTSAGAENPLPAGNSFTVTMNKSPTTFIQNGSAVRQNTLRLTFTPASGAFSEDYTLQATPLGDKLTFPPGALAFGNHLLTSPPKDSPKLTFTVDNAGFSDPLESNTTANVTLTLGDPEHYSWLLNQTSVETKVVQVPAKGAVPVDVYYVRPNLGPAGGPDDSSITWSIGSERTCMGECWNCPAISSGTAVTLTGTVYVGDVDSAFDDERGDFGDVFCGATSNSRDYVVWNGGTLGSSFDITGWSLEKGNYYTVTPPPGCEGGTCTGVTLASGDTRTFVITPDMIPPSAITGPGDLGRDTTNEQFLDTLTITTNAPELDAAGNPTGNSYTIVEPLNMYAKGVIVNPANPAFLTTWPYPTVSWPAVKHSSLTVGVDNQGNIDGRAWLDETTGKFNLTSEPSAVTQTANNEGGAPAPVSSLFGEFDRCDTEAETFNVGGTFMVTADLSDALDQNLTTNGGLVGICQTGASVQKVLDGTDDRCNNPNASECAAWVQALTLQGSVDKTEEMCGSTQCCSNVDGDCKRGNSDTACGTGGEICDDCIGSYEPDQRCGPCPGPNCRQCYLPAGPLN